MLFPVDSGGGTLCPVFPDRGCYPENNNKASRKYSTTLYQPHNLRSQMFRGVHFGTRIVSLSEQVRPLQNDSVDMMQVQSTKFTVR
jgi:hypothetical protein